MRYQGEQRTKAFEAEVNAPRDESVTVPTMESMQKPVKWRGRCWAEGEEEKKRGWEVRKRSRGRTLEVGERSEGKEGGAVVLP